MRRRSSSLDKRVDCGTLVLVKEVQRILAMQVLYIAETYTLRRPNGSKIRIASLVRRIDGKVCRFVERLPNAEAIRQAAALPERVWQ